MSDMTIRRFEPTMANDVVAIYNHVTVRTPFCYPITAELFAEAVTMRKEFDPAGLLVAYADGRPAGLIHAHAIESNGAAQGCVALFLANQRAVCQRLLAAALAHLRQRGARGCSVTANPAARVFYAGVFMGMEVLLWRGYYAVINSLEREAFDQTCEGFIMSKSLEREPDVEPYPADITMRINHDEDSGSFYTNDSIEAYAGEERIGACPYHFLKRLSSHRGQGIGQIGISVDARYHRRRIGSALLTRAHRELYRMGAKTVILATNYALYPAIKLYEKLGYRQELIPLRCYAKAAPAS